MHRLGQYLCRLTTLSLLELSQKLANSAHAYTTFAEARTTARSVPRTRKSVSTERTYAEDFPDNNACEGIIAFFEDLQRRNKSQLRNKIKSRTLKLRFDDFSTTTVSRAGQAVDINVFVN